MDSEEYFRRKANDWLLETLAEAEHLMDAWVGDVAVDFKETASSYAPPCLVSAAVSSLQRLKTQTPPCLPSAPSRTASLRASACESPSLQTQGGVASSSWSCSSWSPSSSCVPTSVASGGASFLNFDAAVQCVHQTCHPGTPRCWLFNASRTETGGVSLFGLAREEALREDGRRRAVLLKILCCSDPSGECCAAAALEEEEDFQQQQSSSRFRAWDFNEKRTCSWRVPASWARRLWRLRLRFESFCYAEKVYALLETERQVGEGAFLWQKLEQSLQLLASRVLVGEGLHVLLCGPQGLRALLEDFFFLADLHFQLAMRQRPDAAVCWSPLSAEESALQRTQPPMQRDGRVPTPEMDSLDICSLLRRASVLVRKVWHLVRHHRPPQQPASGGKELVSLTLEQAVADRLQTALDGARTNPGFAASESPPESPQAEGPHQQFPSSLADRLCQECRERSGSAKEAAAVGRDFSDGGELSGSSGVWTPERRKAGERVCRILLRAQALHSLLSRVVLAGDLLVPTTIASVSTKQKALELADADAAFESSPRSFSWGGGWSPSFRRFSQAIRSCLRAVSDFNPVFCLGIDTFMRTKDFKEFCPGGDAEECSSAFTVRHSLSHHCSISEQATVSLLKLLPPVSGFFKRGVCLC